MSLLSLDCYINLILYKAGWFRGLAVDTPIPCKLSAQFLIKSLNQTNQNLFLCDAVVKNEAGLLLVPSTYMSTPQLTLISTLAGYESSWAKDLNRQGNWTLCPGLRSWQVDEQASPTSASAMAAFYFLGLAAWHLPEACCFHKKLLTLVLLYNIGIFSHF